MSHADLALRSVRGGTFFRCQRNPLTIGGGEDYGIWKRCVALAAWCSAADYPASCTVLAPLARLVTQGKAVRASGRRARVQPNGQGGEDYV
jgi:hypothetical protein